MGLAIGVAAAFFGVAFIIVGWKGGGPADMNQNITGMMKGDYLVADNPSSNTTSTKTTAPVTSTTGGANSSGTK